MLNRFAFGAALLLALAALPGATFARQLRGREIRPAFDFTRIPMPVEVVSVELDGREVRPGEKIQGDDDWLRGVSFTLKNISDKPLAYIELGLQFSQPQGQVVYTLTYGVDLSRGSRRRASSPPAVEPGETVDLVLTKEKYAVLLRILDLGGAARSFDTAPYYIARVCFEGEPDLIWAGGMLKRRDPNRPTEFMPVGRYVLPAGQD